MKLHLPLNILRTLCVAAIVAPAVALAETNRLTEDTVIEVNDTMMTQTSGSLSYTSADASDRKDLTITGATKTAFVLGKGESLSFDGLDVFSMTDNKAQDGESGIIRGGLEKVKGGYISMSDNNKVILDNNDSVAPGGSMYGGVLRSYLVDVNINNNGSVDITNNNYTTTASSQSNTYGGAIYVTGDCLFSMSNNGAVNISGNSLTSKAAAHGGAVDIGQVSGKEVMKWDANQSITVSANTAEGKQARGGALHAKSETSISNTAGKVTFSENKALSASSSAYGGAISLEGNGQVHFNNNGAVEFLNNTAQGKGQTYNDPMAGGAALHGISGTTFDISGNKEVTFTGNVSSNASGKAIGGAIYSTAAGSVVNISGNDNVTFSGNGLVAAGASHAYGGAIYSKGGVSLHDNKSVVFEKNYEKGGDSYRLRSIYAADTSTYRPVTVNLSLSAADGGTFTIRDSITVSGDLSLNADYEGKSQTGTFIFTGKTTESDLNEIIAANTAEGETARTATAAEITLSRTSDITGSITLHNGTLSLQDNAIVKATELVVAEGAVLEGMLSSDMVMALGLDDADEALLTAATLDADLVLEDGAIVNLNGGNIDLNGNALTMGSNVQVTYTGTVAEGEEVVLFKNVGNAAGDGTEFELTLNGKSTIATVNDGNVVVDYTAPAVPEPTTATLSLLALAGLAARRRRK